jgi:hypothetical protein
MRQRLIAFARLHAPLLIVNIRSVVVANFLPDQPELVKVVPDPSAGRLPAVKECKKRDDQRQHRDRIESCRRPRGSRRLAVEIDPHRN